MIYQELLSRVRPDWIVETATGAGGKALFLASICELLGHGQVLGIDQGAVPADRLPAHPRIRYLAGNPSDPATVDAVRDAVGTPARGLVIISLASRELVVAMFGSYAPLVPVGGYVVVEDTIYNGHPVWPGMGPGPAEGVRDILRSRDDFVADPAPDRYGVTFNRGGFLRRVR
jgi:cephalosporin hydroxylase